MYIQPGGFSEFHRTARTIEALGFEIGIILDHQQQVARSESDLQQSDLFETTGFVSDGPGQQPVFESTSPGYSGDVEIEPFMHGLVVRFRVKLLQFILCRNVTDESMGTFPTP